jgi:hypothetical protein
MNPNAEPEPIAFDLLVVLPSENPSNTRSPHKLFLYEEQGA